MARMMGAEAGRFNPMSINTSTIIFALAKEGISCDLPLNFQAAVSVFLAVGFSHAR
jgi:hypothetical protein